MALGGFDESMHRAQDWELNHRLRESGRNVWFSPELRVTYRPRSTLRALVKQMYDTGKWRREVIARYPDTASVRYLAPPVTVAAMLLGLILGLIGVAGGSRLLKAGFAAPAGYTALIVGGSLVGTPPMTPAARLRLPLVLAATHIAWGAGFLVGLRK